MKSVRPAFGAVLAVLAALIVASPVATRQAVGPIQMEIRLAETTPSIGLAEAVVTDGSNRKLYLHATPLVTAADVAAAVVVDDDGIPGIRVTLTNAASGRLLAGTRAHSGRFVAVIVDGRVVSAPLINAGVGVALISNRNFTPDTARSVAARLRAAGSGDTR